MLNKTMLCEDYDDYLNDILLTFDLKAWEAASELDSEQGYSTYLEEFSEGQFAASALERLAAFEEDLQRWKKAKRANRIRSYEAYLENDPICHYQSEAQERLAYLNEEKTYWQNVSSLDTEEQYQSYLEKYPKGKFIKQAKAAITAIRDASAWETAQKTDTKEAYKAYLEGFPEGKNAEHAQKRLAEFEESIKADRKAWRAAKAADTIAGYEEYLNSGTLGKYREEAQKGIHNLIDQLDEVAWIEACQIDTEDEYRAYLHKYPEGCGTKFVYEKLLTLKDKAAWLSACEEDTVGAYQAYLEAFPEGVFADQAEAKTKAPKKKKTLIYILMIFVIGIVLLYIFARSEIRTSPYAYISDHYSGEFIGYGNETGWFVGSTAILAEKRGYEPARKWKSFWGGDVNINLGDNYEEIGLAHFEKREYEKAYQNLVKIKDQGYVWFELGYSADEIGKVNEAIGYYKKSNSGAAWHNIGGIYENRENLTEAFKAYSRSSEKGSLYGHCRLASSYWYGKGTEENELMAWELVKTKKFADIDYCNELKGRITNKFK